MKRKQPLLYTEEMKEFIQNNQYGIDRKTLTDMFNKHFGTQYSAANISGYCKRNKLKNGKTGRFCKGQEAHNKGKKVSEEQYEKMKRTMFQKGHTPKNHKPIGSERIAVTGYIEIKVAEPNKWRLKQDVVWEQHFGKIPKGNRIMLLDRNKLNVKIENLQMVSNQELLVINRYRLMTEYPELNKTVKYLAKQINETEKAKKKNKERDPMKYIEKLAEINPEAVNDRCAGGAEGCPWIYGLEKKEDKICGDSPINFSKCDKCWNRQMLRGKETQYEV